MVYDITNPSSPVFNQYVHTMDSITGQMTDIAPEGLVFVPANQSHTGKAMLIVSNEVSGTTTIYEVVVATNVSLLEKRISNFSVYPNPTSGTINLEGDLIPKHVRIIDITGKVVMETPLNSNTLNIEFLNNGLYFGQFMGENDEQVTKRILKQ